jgi:hypothetical protein
MASFKSVCFLALSLISFGLVAFLPTTVSAEDDLSQILGKINGVLSGCQHLSLTNGELHYLHADDRSLMESTVLLTDLDRQKIDAINNENPSILHIECTNFGDPRVHEHFIISSTFNQMYNVSTSSTSLSWRDTDKTINLGSLDFSFHSDTRVETELKQAFSQLLAADQHASVPLDASDNEFKRKFDHLETLLRQYRSLEETAFDSLNKVQGLQTRLQNTKGAENQDRMQTRVDDAEKNRVDYLNKANDKLDEYRNFLISW